MDSIHFMVESESRQFHTALFLFFSFQLHPAVCNGVVDVE